MRTRQHRRPPARSCFLSVSGSGDPACELRNFLPLSKAVAPAIQVSRPRGAAAASPCFSQTLRLLRTPEGAVVPRGVVPTRGPLCERSCHVRLPRPHGAERSPRSVPGHLGLHARLGRARSCCLSPSFLSSRSRTTCRFSPRLGHRWAQGSPPCAQRGGLTPGSGEHRGCHRKSLQSQTAGRLASSLGLEGPSPTPTPRTPAPSRGPVVSNPCHLFRRLGKPALRSIVTALNLPPGGR